MASLAFSWVDPHQRTSRSYSYLSDFCSDGMIDGFTSLTLHSIDNWLNAQFCHEIQL